MISHTKHVDRRPTSRTSALVAGGFALGVIVLFTCSRPTSQGRPTAPVAVDLMPSGDEAESVAEPNSRVEVSASSGAEGVSVSDVPRFSTPAVAALDSMIVLIDPHGDPWPNLTLHALRTADGRRWSERSDEAGRVDLHGARDQVGSAVELRVDGPEVWPCRWTRVLGAIESCVVPRVTDLDVLVTDQTARPIAGAHVRMTPCGSNLRESRPGPEATDVKGRVRLRAVVGADVNLQATSQGFIGKMLQMQHLENAVGASREFTLARAAQHRLEFFDVGGHTVAGLVLSDPNGLVADVTTASDGAVVVPVSEQDLTLWIAGGAASRPPIAPASACDAARHACSPATARAVVRCVRG